MTEPKFAYTRTLGIEKIDVYIGTDPLEEEDCVTSGVYSPSKKRITVYDNKLSTEIHEAIHAILDVGGWSEILSSIMGEKPGEAVEEALVGALETGLTQMGFVRSGPIIPEKDE